MSNQETGLPDPVEAYNHLFSEVHATTFLNKLAAAGVNPASEQDVRDLFQLAGELRQVVGEKQASAAEGRFSGAVRDLQGVTRQNPEFRKQQEGLAIKQAAYSALQDPNIYNSLLSLHLQESALVNS